MADRRQSFSFRFWPARRTPATQTPTPSPPPPPPTTSSAPAARPTAESQPVSLQSTTGTTNPTSTAPPTTETQTPPPPATTNSAPTATPTAESQAVSREPTTNTTPLPTAETTGSNPPNPTSPPIASQIADQPHTTTIDPKTPPPNEMQIASQQLTTTTLTGRTDDPKTSSPYTETKSPLSSKPASPSRRTTQSRSPPPPSSPSRPALQARSIMSSSPSRNSKTPTTPQRASQPHSPSRLTSKQITPNSPKERQPNSPSKESRQIAQATSSSNEAQTLASDEKDSKPEASQQEPQPKAEIKSDSADDKINGVEETKFKHNEVKEMPSKSTQLGNTTTTTQSVVEKPITTEKVDSSTMNGEREPLVELKAKHEETKDVKEVAQPTKIEANEETRKEVDNFLNPKFGSEGPIIEKSEIPSTPDEVHTEKQEVLEKNDILKPTNDPTSQPKKRSTNSHNKSAPTIGQVSLNKDIRDDISTFVNHMAIGDLKNAINDRNVSIITLAGENRGASMQMGSTLKEGPVHIHRGYKINPDESAETTTDGEGSSNGKRFEDGKVTEDQPTEAYVNNNAQGINNSIVFNASVAERSPGVHMVVSHVPKEPIRSAEKISPLETRRAEFNMSRSEKLTYEPTVKRRCLRGLFLETSDSDPENPEKPRRHGCRVGCKLKEKENGIDVL